MNIFSYISDGVSAMFWRALTTLNHMILMAKGPPFIENFSCINIKFDHVMWLMAPSCWNFILWLYFVLLCLIINSFLDRTSPINIFKRQLWINFSLHIPPPFALSPSMKFIRNLLIKNKEMKNCISVQLDKRDTISKIIYFKLYIFLSLPCHA